MMWSLPWVPGGLQGSKHELHGQCSHSGRLLFGCPFELAVLILREAYTVCVLSLGCGTCVLDSRKPQGASIFQGQHMGPEQLHASRGVGLQDIR